MIIDPEREMGPAFKKFENCCFSLYFHVIQGSLNKFPDFFCMGTFIDSKHMKLYFPSK